jgi:uncharacterized protein (TIGR02266 family)
MSTELRREPRAKLEVQINLESDHNFYAGITGNISMGGVFVATYTPPPLDTIVEMDLQLEGHTFHLRGLVCWVREAERASDFAPAGCGLQFVSLPKDAEQVITHFVGKRDTIFYDDE